MSTSITQPAAPNTIGISGFFTDAGFDFVTRSMIGYAAQGVMDVGQVFATIARITDGNADSWYTAWRATAEKLHGQAKASLAAGHTATAHRRFLAASEGYAQAVAFSDGQSDQATFAPTFALQTECWEFFIDSAAGRIERVAVPYEKDVLPGFLFRPDSSGAKRPTVVMTNGSEGSKSGLWAWGVAATLARGWNAFIYDGPGQQNMLFDKGHPFRPDWEAVLTPVVDALTARGDVDGLALFAYGCSQAGYWVARALAFEHRFVAAVVDPGVMDVAASWLANIPPTLVAVLKAGKKDEFNAAMAMAARNPKMAEVIAARGRPFAKPSVYDTFKAAMEYNLREVIGQIKTPLLITDPDEEAFWPGQSKEVYAQLTGEREILHYSREDGANWHCEPMGRLEVELQMLDFFQDRLARIIK
ncbi:MAG: dipeptidyl aminopeptidase [Bryobacteraceae bacterium]|jgi:hypothetical protein